MKVVHAINSLSLGGAEVFVAQLAIAQRSYCDVQVWTYAGAQDDGGRELLSDLRRAGVNVRSIGVRNRKLKAIVPFIWRAWVNEERPDLINAHLDQSEIFISIATRGMRRRPALVRTLHNTRISVPLARRFQHWLCGTFDATVACSDAVLEAPYRTGPAAVSIPNGIALPTIPPPEECARIRRALGLPEDKAVVLCVGSMSFRAGQLQKGQDRILRAVAASGVADRVLVAFLGDGEQREALQGLAGDLGLDTSVRFCGAVPPRRKWDYIAACDCGIIFSRFEGLPINGIEFACAGVPLILSDIAELRPFVGPGGIVASEEQLPEAFRRVVGALPRWQKEASRLQSSYRERYAIHSTADRYRALYGEILRHKNSEKTVPAAPT